MLIQIVRYWYTSVNALNLNSIKTSRKTVPDFKWDTDLTYAFLKAYA